ncbi:MAG: ATP-binding cassette domain-containing protein [Rubrivivax sp.]
MSRIELQSLHKHFGDGTKRTPVLRDVSLAIEPGELCVFIGPSGCGKSTLLRLIAGLEDASAGHVLIDGQVVDDLTPAERDVAMVFQSYALYPHMSVRQNLAFGLTHQRRRRLDSADIDRRVDSAVRMLGLSGLLQRKPRELSGGQRQRVAIGRAVVRQPRILLLDEPLSNLDAALRVQTRLEIAKLHRDLGDASMVYVTHDQVEAMTLADRIVLLRPLSVQGDDAQTPSVAQIGSPMELYHHPANRFVAGFMGSPAMNLIDARVAPADAAPAADGGVALLLHGSTFTAQVSGAGLAPGDAVTAGIRPDRVRLGGGPGRARVSHVEPLGDAVQVYLEIAPQVPTLLVRTDRSDLRRGETVAYDLPAPDLHVFRSDGNAQPRRRR